VAVDQVKLLIVERNGVDLQDQEEVILDADMVPFDAPGFTADNVKDAIIESQENDDDYHSAQYDVDISDILEVKLKKQMFVFQQLIVTGQVIVNGWLVVGD
jgi:hypothetical protein